MKARTSYSDALEAADGLDRAGKEEQVEILERRMAEERRKELLREVAESGKQLKKGRCRPMTPEQIMRAVME